MLLKNMVVTGNISLLKVPIETGDIRVIPNRQASAVLFSPNGVSVYRSENKECVADCHHAVFLPQGASYTIECIKGDICPMVNFECVNGYEDLEEFPLRDVELIKTSFETARHKNSYGVPYHQFAFVYELFDFLAREFFERGTEIPGCMKKAVRFMEAQAGDSELSNERVAAEISMSTVYFRKMFKKYYGVPPMKYLADFRLNCAKELLSETGFSVFEISEKVGYSSLYSFSRAFKNSVGVSPQKFRNEL